MNAATFAIFAYVLLQLGIGYAVSRNVRSESDYLLAGRKLGPLLAFFSVFATWFGAETCIGSAGEAYAGGLSAVRADPFGYAGCLLLMGLFLAAPLWRRGLTTLGDLFRDRFGPRAEKLAVIVMVPSSVMWAGAQIRAFGQVLSANAGHDATIMITVAAAIVIAYTAVGGMMADAVTDLVQGLVLVLGLVMLLVVAFASGELSTISSVPAAHLAFSTHEEGFFDIAESWAVPLLGSLVAQELISRVCAARSPEVARNAALLAAPFYLAIGLIPVVIALASTAVLPELDDPEHVLPLAAQRYFHPAMQIVFQGALVSAILSTVDSALLVSGSLVAHNLVLPLRPSLDEAGKLRVNRIAVMVFGVIAYGLALSADGVYELVEAASAFGSAGVFTCTFFGLYTKLGGEESALASLAVGVLAYGIGEQVLELSHPFLISVVSSILVFGLIALVDRKTPNGTQAGAAP